MEISVIIPVYNAKPFIRKAALSALQQSEVSEVLLIEDASIDNSLKTCINLESEYKKIRLLKHSDGKNHGAATTRNLGIKNAEFEYIAFLDADDFYLPQRFQVPKELFKKNHDIDGVYEAVGLYFYDECGKRKWLSKNRDELTTIRERLDAKDLFEGLVKDGKGSLHLDGIVVKKSLFKKCGYFSEQLKLHQDSTLIIQMSECGKLIPGRLNKPVAMRGIHKNNRILNNINSVETKCMARKTLFYWGYREKLSKRKLVALFYNYMMYLIIFQKNSKCHSALNCKRITKLLEETFRHPFLSFTIIFEHFSRKKSLSSKK